MDFHLKRQICFKFEQKNVKKWPIEISSKYSRNWPSEFTIKFGQLMLAWLAGLSEKYPKLFLTGENNFLNWKFIERNLLRNSTFCFGFWARHRCLWKCVQWPIRLEFSQNVTIYIWGSPGVRGGPKILKISQKLSEGAIPVSNYFTKSWFILLE